MVKQKERRAEVRRNAPALERPAPSGSSARPADLFAAALRLHQAGRLAEAEPLYRQALALDPNHVHALHYLGALAHQAGRSDIAADLIGRAVALDVRSPNAHNSLGAALKALGRADEAAAAHRRAIALKPDFAVAHNNLAAALQDQGRLDEAIAACRRAIALQPDLAMAHLNLGAALRDQGELDAAVASCRQALALKPDYVEAWVNLGAALKDQGMRTEAAAAYGRAIALQPDYDLAHSNLILLQAGAPHSDLGEGLDLARRHGKILQQRGGAYSAWTSAPAPDRLRVGLVSGDLKDHPVGYFLEAILAKFDPARIELIAYPTHPETTALTERIKPLFSAWRPVHGLSDEAAAAAIHADGVHVLIDLAGHMAHNRLGVFARRPAPVQASWLGYFATTGVQAMDYLIGDPFVTPPGEAGHLTETPWALPETYLCFTPPDVALEVGALPAASGEGVTFGSFNTLMKMTDAVVTLWARVLQATPGSKLFLKTKQLNDAPARQGVERRFAAHGIAADRLILEGGSPRAELLAAYNRVDIALDPFPYPGGTTSVEALWMGAPFVTRRGDRFLSHLGESIAHNAGLADWIADDDEAYVAIAAGHAADLLRLASLRAGLRSQVLASPLFDAPRFARHLEHALWGMWARRQSGRPA